MEIEQSYLIELITALQIKKREPDARSKENK
jgi:hypothetical protein